MLFPGRIVYDLYGSRWVLSYTFNSKTLQIPYFSAERVRITSYSVKYLSDSLAMIRIIMARLERDRPSIRPSDKFSFREVLRSICSPHVIIVFILAFLVGSSSFGLALFLPSIVSGLGFSKTKTQLLSVGPFGAGFMGACIRWAHPQN